MNKDTTIESEKLELRSLSPVIERRAELLQLFPEARTEGGKLDFEQLKRALGETVDAGKERYGLVWPGKAECFKTIQAPSAAALLPARKESVNFDETDNLVIEGDSLEVLKLMQKSYLSKIKLIYIDPPYNTGNDFIYPDNYAESLETYLEYTGQMDSHGYKFGTNTETDGRFHSKWLSMIYPRLYLARNLLHDEGVIWVSIDDGELENLRRVLDEVFGEENFVATFIWEKRRTRENRRVFSFNHDYIICYAKNKPSFELARNLLPITDEVRARYANPDNDPRDVWQSVSLAAQAGHGTAAQFYEITTPGGRKIEPPPGNCWRVTRERLQELIADNRVWFGQDGNNVPRQKIFLSEQENYGLTPHTLWTAEEVGTTDSAKRELNALFDGVSVFDTPKPVPLVERIATISTSPEDIVLDFFAGAGVTAEAVIDLNKKDGGKRNFIIVQLPEKTGVANYPTVAEVTKERVRRVLAKLRDDKGKTLDLQKSVNQDLGFRVFKLAELNFKTWDARTATNASAVERQLDLHIDHLREGRTSQEILYEILLKCGFPLTAQVGAVALGGLDVFSVADGALLICLERKLTLDAIRAMADKKPERVVCLDEGFAGNDQLKTNAVQTFKAKNVVFRTV